MKGDEGGWGKGLTTEGYLTNTAVQARLPLACWRATNVTIIIYLPQKC